MSNDIDYKEVVNQYFIVSQKSFEIGCYHRWEEDRDSLIGKLFCFFTREQYDAKILANILITCDETLSDFFPKISKERRLYDWPKDKDEEMRRRIQENISASL